MASGIYSLRQLVTANTLGILTPPTASANTPYLEYLVVAGGGSGGRNTGGGGGAGGLLTGVVPVVKGVTYTMTVGAGGSSWSSGANSSITGANVSIITVGGGRGGSIYAYCPPCLSFASGQSGGSGGGAARYGLPGQGIQGQGFKGGKNGYDNGYDTAGSGGGAATEGGIGDCGVGASWGGQGLSLTISGTLKSYASGGTGAGYGFSSSFQYPALPGGGGAAAICTATNGSTNTGGGGGGAVSGSVTQSSGGSGIIIVRYPSSYSAAASTTGSPTVSTTGGYRIYSFTGTGTITI